MVPDASALRCQAARRLPHGYRESVAAEVRAALERPGAAADPGALARLLERTAREVPFYRALGPRPFAELPVVNKGMLIADRSAFLSPAARSRGISTRFSSGSSGVPFETPVDRERMIRHRAELVGAYRFLGADPFGPFLHCRPWFMLRRSQRIAHALRGQRLWSGETDPATLRSIARWLRGRRGVTIVGLSSFLDRLLDGLSALGEQVPPGAVAVVLAVGEPAPRSLVEATPRVLGVELSRRYSNTENGLLGFARAGSTSYRLDTSTFHVEILDRDADVPAAPGAVGRIVVTDLFGRAMPFLRYDTGDLGRLALDGTGRTLPGELAELVGRGGDVLVGGTAEAPRRADHFELFMRVDSLPGLRQFQLRQHGIGHFTWTLAAEPSEELERTLHEELRRAVGPLDSCRLEYLAEVPIEVSGKRRFLVSEIADPGALLAAS